MNKRWIIILFLVLLGNALHAQQHQVKKEEFLIGIFWPPVWAHTNDLQYKRMREANIDLIENVSSTDLYTTEKNRKMLDLAARHGMKVIVADPRVHGSTGDVQAMVNDFKNHPATFGYYIMDEPDTAKLNWCAQTLKTIVAADPTRMAHVNLFPVYALGAQLGSINYEKEYIERWIEMAGKENIEYLAFDHYPYAGDGSFRISYYENMDIIRRAGLKYGLKTSAYLQSMGVPGAFKRPTEGELRYNVYSMLAYGIKHPVWFTYWTPAGQGEKFLPSVVDTAGNPTDLYPQVKQLGAEMKQLGKTLIGLDAKEVYHSGSQLPEGVLNLPAGAVLSPVGKGDFIFSQFKDKVNGQEYIMIVNKDYNYNQSVVLRIGKSVKSIVELGKTGSDKKINWEKNRELKQQFLPGEGRLFRIVY